MNTHQRDRALALSPSAAGRVAERFRALGYTTDGVTAQLGPAVSAAYSRGDLAAVDRATRSQPHGVTALIRLFLLGTTAPAPALRAALGATATDDLQAAGILTGDHDTVRAVVDIRPYSETEPAPGDTAEHSWWVVSDFGADVRRGPLPTDHVLGIGAAATTLAQAVSREPAERALDLGIGCGVQALHLSRHCAHVMGTDISSRALAMAAATAALNGQTWDLRRGDLLAPVADEQFDLIVANPPFVVGPAVTDFDYRDSGRSGDGVSAELVAGLPARLREGGRAHLLANWVITADQTWDERVHSWLDGSGCDAWIWQREVADPAEYVALWLRDAGIEPGHPGYQPGYDAWLDWFEQTGGLAVGMGMVHLWRSGDAASVIRCEDLPQALAPPVGPAVRAWWQCLAWLRTHDDRALLGSALTPAADLVRTDHAVAGRQGWQTELTRLRQTGGLRWEIDSDPAIADLIAGLAHGAPLGVALELLASRLELSTEQVTRAAVPVIRDLIQRGLLEPRR